MDKRSPVKNKISIPSGFNDEACGFSLVELMMAMAVGLVVLAAAYSIFNVQNKALSAQEQIVELQQNVRAAVDMMTRDIRMAGYNPTNASFTGLTVGTSQVEIRADLDGNGSLSGQEDIIYAYDSTNSRITRNIGAGAQPFAENIEAFTVTAINASRIRVVIRGRAASPDQSYASNSGYRTYTLTSDITVRNPIPP